ncbi:MAG: molecular chaperone TorD family protein [Desulfatirhabdiaceae bacterium]
MENQQEFDWQMARSHVYGLLSQFLSEQPSEQHIDHLIRPETIELMEAMFDDQHIGDPCREMAALYSNGTLSADQVALDFESLMRVPGPAYTHPYESCYRDRIDKKGSQHWGNILGRHAFETEQYYLSDGLSPKYDRVDFPDHIGAELAYMAHLCELEAKALAEGERQTASQIRQKQQIFTEDHLFHWALEFSADLLDRSNTPFFSGVAEMLHAFIRMEKAN